MEENEGASGPARGKDGRWTKGNSGNPRGRPVGARGQFGEVIYARLAAHLLSAKGEAALDGAANDRPIDYLRVLADLAPRDDAWGDGSGISRIIHEIIDPRREGFHAGPEANDDEPEGDSKGKDGGENDDDEGDQDRGADAA